MNSTSTIAHQKTEQTENIDSRIIEAAKQEFIKKGFEQTSMSDIAAVVGINRPTLHYYFRTKDKMFQAVFASIVAKFLPHIDTIFSTQQSFSEKLEDVIDVYVSIFSTNPLLPNLIETFYSLNLDQYLKHIGEFLEKEMESGNFKKVPLPFIFMTLYSQLAFPFLSKNLTMKLFFNEDKDTFNAFLQEWKQHIISQITYLLKP